MENYVPNAIPSTVLTFHLIPKRSYEVGITIVDVDEKPEAGEDQIIALLTQ